MARNIREDFELRILSQVLSATGGNAPSMEEKLRQLQLFRRDPEDLARNERIDTFLIEEIARYAEGVRTAGECQKKLKAIFDQLSAPPLHPAIFLGYQSEGRDRAMVGCGGSRRIVIVPAGEETNNLEIGDEVLLSNEMNTVVSKPPRRTLLSGETALFDRYTGEGKLVLKSRGDEEVVVEASAALCSDDLRCGDMVRYDRSIWVAYEKIERSKGEGYFLEKTPRETFDQIGGLDEAITTLKRMFLLHQIHREKTEKYALPSRTSLLLDGPPGNGKTLLVKALANWLGARSPSGSSFFMNIKPSELHSMWYAQTEANYREVFRIAREAGAADPDRPVILFFDEIDSVGRARGGSYGEGVGDRVITAFLAELDGLEERGNVVVIGATNRADLLDSGLTRTGRMGDKRIHVPRPNREAAREIFERHMEPEIPYAWNGCDREESRRRIIESAVSRIYSPNGEGDLCALRFRDGTARVARAADLISGASIASIAVTAKESACVREIEGGCEGIGMEDMLEAVTLELETLASYLTPGNCRSYMSDLPQDRDVVAVDRISRRVRGPHRYLNVA